MKKLLLFGLSLTMLLTISSGLLVGWGTAPVSAAVKLGNPIHIPLVKGSAPSGPSSTYLHIFDNWYLGGCDAYISTPANISNLGTLSKCGSGTWDNAITSFIVQNGAWVTFYKDTNYGGDSITFTGPDGYDYIGADWDNQISSLKLGWTAAPAQ